MPNEEVRTVRPFLHSVWGWGIAGIVVAIELSSLIERGLTMGTFTAVLCLSLLYVSASLERFACGVVNRIGELHLLLKKEESEKC